MFMKEMLIYTGIAWRLNNCMQRMYVFGVLNIFKFLWQFNCLTFGNDF